MIHLIFAILTVAQATIYGDDNRQEFSEVSTQLQELSLSSVALVPANLIGEIEPGRFLHSGSRYPLCQNEKFNDQESLANCSGVLVAPQVVLTAGHCLYQSDCNFTRFVFGFQNDERRSAQRVFNKNQVYSCEKILYWQGHGLHDEEKMEYAIVQLDRAVEAPYRPAKIAANFDIPEETNLLMIGYPLGLPMKFSPGISILNSAAGERVLVSSVDAFAGNSGSPIFNENGELLAILVRGGNDFTTGESDSCQAVKHCDEHGCGGSISLKIREILPYLH